jgi:hypothetical protein
METSPGIIQATAPVNPPPQTPDCPPLPSPSPPPPLPIISLSLVWQPFILKLLQKRMLILAFSRQVLRYTAIVQLCGL